MHSDVQVRSTVRMWLCNARGHARTHIVNSAQIYGTVSQLKIQEEEKEEEEEEEKSEGWKTTRNVEGRVRVVLMTTGSWALLGLAGPDGTHCHTLQHTATHTHSCLFFFTSANK